MTAQPAPTASDPAASVDRGALAADHVVVGAGDPAATVAFFEALGLTVLERRTLAAEVAADLHGIEGSTEEILLGVPGRPTGGVRVVATPLPQVDRGDFFRGGHAIDFYTTDMAASVTSAQGAGAVVGPVAEYPFGPVELQQAQAVGPDSIDVVFVGINHRLPSVLDDEPTRLHSEVHSVVAAVDDLAAETAFWTEIAGLELKSQFPIDVPAVSEFMMLPRHAPLKMSVMVGPGAAPPRFELLAYDDAEGRLTPSRPLTAGAIVPVFTVSGLASFRELLLAGGATAGAPIETDGTLACWVRSPGGVDVELRERLS
jgi:catechol 2,3-dioxygenase-like lactoylglutathione lyase family enzyme